MKIVQNSSNLKIHINNRICKEGEHSAAANSVERGQVHPKQNKVCSRRGSQQRSQPRSQLCCELCWQRDAQTTSPAGHPACQRARRGGGTSSACELHSQLGNVQPAAHHAVRDSAVRSLYIASSEVATRGLN